MSDDVMPPAQFKRWRKGLGLSQKDAGEALGLKRRMIQYYEKGERDGEAVTVPRSVRLACWALAQGQDDYAGPEGDELRVRAKKDKKSTDEKG